MREGGKEGRNDVKAKRERGRECTVTTEEVEVESKVEELNEIFGRRDKEKRMTKIH